MWKNLRIATGVFVACLLFPGFARAGMPSVQLTDVATARLDTLSFFLLGGLLSAAVIRVIWNSLSRDFPAMPKLSYRGALGVTLIWGLLSLLVLTMISGARELLTPGAWKKTGLTYTLADDSRSADAATTESFATHAERIHALEQLKTLLWAHAGAFPDSMETAEFADELWAQPGLPGVRYIYRSGQKMEREGRPLVIENQVYDDSQYVLFTSGVIRSMPASEIGQLAAESTAVAREPTP